MLLDYSTTVPAARTIAEVQRKLVSAGARTVVVDYDEDGHPTGLAFTIATPHGPRAFALPVRTAAVEKVLAEQGVARRYAGPEQAERVAWRIVKDWLEAQLALLESAQVTLTQIMLPYLRTEEGDTLYEVFVSSEQKALGR